MKKPSKKMLDVKIRQDCCKPESKESFGFEQEAKSIQGMTEEKAKQLLITSGKLLLDIFEFDKCDFNSDGYCNTHHSFCTEDLICENLAERFKKFMVELTGDNDYSFCGDDNA